MHSHYKNQRKAVWTKIYFKNYFFLEDTRPPVLYGRYIVTNLISVFSNWKQHLDRNWAGSPHSNWRLLIPPLHCHYRKKLYSSRQPCQSSLFGIINKLVAFGFLKSCKYKCQNLHMELHVYFSEAKCVFFKSCLLICLMLRVVLSEPPFLLVRTCIHIGHKLHVDLSKDTSGFFKSFIWTS